MQQRETAAIPKLVLSTGDQLLRRIVIDKPRMTIGRRPFNDVMLDDLTVSGEHAVVHTAAGTSTIHDLRSRNGTLVNGVPVTQRALADGDRIDIGIYRLHYVIERGPVERAEPSMPASGDPMGLAVLSGAQAGSTLRLDRPIVSITDPTGQVAVVAHRRSGWVITHLEGPGCPSVNGEPIGLGSHPLRPGDLIELGGTIFRFQPDPPP
ncbi:MAG: FHA domain-containing protein [Burkholderiales bacterium]|nr:MAG: FHA domain-containing protein [Burkholderiales bacterium]